MKSLILALVAFASFLPQGSAQNKKSSEKSNTKPLLFQANLNGLQVLPQRFEYALMDANTLRIGDIIIKTSEMSFDIVSQKSGNKSFVFRWPAGLLSEGTIVLKNNNGKALFTQDFTSAMLKKVQSEKTAQEDEESAEDFRNEIVELKAEPENAEVFNDLKYLPFMSYCVFRTTEETNTSLCSNELYLSSEGGQTIVKTRASTKKSAYVDINGKTVGSQGIIFLNDRTENIEFRTQMESGASLEISTRMKEIDFKDLVLDEDGKRIVITASGANPVNEEKVRRLPNGDWQTKLLPVRPQIWLKGDGDIPMRQEFFIKGNLPKESDRAFVSARTQQELFGSSVRILGIGRPGVQVQTKEENASITPLTKNNQFYWNIENLASGGPHRRFVTLTNGENNFVAGLDFIRGTPYSLKLGGSYLTSSGQMLAASSATWWIEDLFYLNSDFSKFHWGLQFENDFQLMKKSSDAKLSANTLTLLYRYHAGFPYLDSTWGLGLSYKMLTVESTELGLLGFKLYLNQKIKESYKSYASYWEPSFEYYLGQSKNSVKIDGFMNLQVKAIRPLANNLFVHAGIGYQSLMTKPSDSKNSNLKLFSEVEWTF